MRIRGLFLLAVLACPTSAFALKGRVVDQQGRLAYRDLAPTPAEIPSNAALIAALERLG